MYLRDIADACIHHLVQPYTILECRFFHYTHLQIRKPSQVKIRSFVFGKDGDWNPSGSQLLPFATTVYLLTPMPRYTSFKRKDQYMATYMRPTVGNIHVDNVECVNGHSWIFQTPIFQILWFSVFQTLIPNISPRAPSWILTKFDFSLTSVS